jgi:C4-dicarboxylate-specific signal transduction histidine kinase
MPATGSPGIDDAAARLRESLYTAVGFGVLGFQQAQVRRRQLQRELSRLAAEVDERVDPVLDDLEARLSDEVRPLVSQARSAVRSAQRTLLGPPPRR